MTKAALMHGTMVVLIGLFGLACTLGHGLQAQEVVSTPEPAPEVIAAVEVVKTYMVAVQEEKRPEAESLVMSPSDKLSLRPVEPQLFANKADPSERQIFELPRNPDWYSLLRDVGYILNETVLLELDESRAVVNAIGDIAPDGKTPLYQQSVIFILRFRNEKWVIQDIEFGTRYPLPKREKGIGT